MLFNWMKSVRDRSCKVRYRISCINVPLTLIYKFFHFCISIASDREHNVWPIKCTYFITVFRVKKSFFSEPFRPTYANTFRRACRTTDTCYVISCLLTIIDSYTLVSTRSELERRKSIEGKDGPSSFQSGEFIKLPRLFSLDERLFLGLRSDVVISFTWLLIACWSRLTSVVSVRASTLSFGFEDAIEIFFSLLMIKESNVPVLFSYSSYVRILKLGTMWKELLNNKKLKL